MIAVGIHSNLVLKKIPTKNEQGTLEIEVKKVVEGDAMDAFNSTSDTFEQAEENNFRIFNPIQAVAFGTEQTSDQIKAQINKFRTKLSHILLGYKTEDQLKWDILRGTGVTGANMDKKLKDQAILDKIYDNIVTDFITNLAGVDLNKRFRGKFNRQSANKHFAKFPDSNYGYSGKNAFWEPMDVPKEQSNLVYSAWEIKNKYNDPTPVDKPQASEETLAQQKAETEELFG